MTLTDITTRTPAEIDTEIARLSIEIERASSTAEYAQDQVLRIDKVAGTYEAEYPWNSPAKRAEYVEKFDAAIKQIAALQRDLEPLETEYVQRGGWTRYYLVLNSNGHIHSSTSCSTCFPTTVYGWLTEQSGMTAEALVEEAGETACTECFPWAPVDVLSRKSRIKYTTQEQRERAEEKARKQAEKEAAQVVVPGYFEGRSYKTGEPIIRERVFKSDRAATNDISGHLTSLCWYGTTHPSAEEWLHNIAKTREALSAKGVEFDYDKALTNARKRVNRETSPGYAKY